jgi:two-component system, OmpR family, phosphate regulon response regulator PhoB
MNADMSSGRTVLVVDDNPDLLFLVAESLGKLGHFTVVTADNGSEGLERYYQTRPDCVIIDVKMPGLDGYQLVRALRGDPATRATPLIILSALIQERDRLAGLLSGADHYLMKPIAPAELIDVVSRVIAENVEHRHERERRFLAQVADEHEGEHQ